ncbi:hypothetical protein HYQ46_000546 [Verticillium longisporum]|nr:hypothetical protein HYQ46_000546 [Verticillium longisporum]
MSSKGGDRRAGLRGLQQEGADGEQSSGSNHDCDDTSKPMGLFMLGDIGRVRRPRNRASFARICRHVTAASSVAGRLAPSEKI